MSHLGAFVNHFKLIIVVQQVFVRLKAGLGPYTKCNTVETGYKNTGYKNIPVIRTSSLETFLYVPLLILPSIRTYRL